MATLETWGEINSGQTNADSPINETLMNSIREDLYHLKQALFQGSQI